MVRIYFNEFFKMIIKKSTCQVGEKAEWYIKNLYEQEEYSLVEKNYRYKRCEIDLIFKKEDLLVFVEVKFRKSKSFGNPEEFVSADQQDRIMEAADNFILEKKWTKNIRFDIAAVSFSSDQKIMHEIFYDVF